MVIGMPVSSSAVMIVCAVISVLGAAVTFCFIPNDVVRRI